MTPDGEIATLQAEHNLRMLRAQRNVSTCFRSEGGASAFARMRGYRSTLRTQAVALLTTLEALSGGQQPSYPAVT